MTIKPGSPADRQIEDLRRRLDEAEETLRAIRHGEVDALLIGGDCAEVFTLEGGTESYHTFMEAMEVGAAALDLDHRVLYANHALGGLLDQPLEALQRTGLLALFDDDTGAVIGDVLRTGSVEKRSTEIKLVRAGEALHLLLTASPLRLGLSSGIAVTLTDMSERVRAAAGEESERLARAVLASANEAMVVCDPNGIVSHANAAAAALALRGRPLVGRPFEEAIPLQFPDISGLMRADDLVALATKGASVQGIEASLAGTSRVQDLLVSAAPLVVAGDRIQGCVVTMVDLTQRKAAERQQQLLMGELDHRVKNTLTLVLSICSRTAANALTVAEYQKAVISRIEALAATHNLLADKWSEVTIGHLVSAELAPFAGPVGAQVLLRGLDVPVTARAAAALGLVFHELTTNAVKYGALSQPSGRLKIGCEPLGTAPALAVVWEESGGPPVTHPKRQGFGHTVIARSLAYDPAGGAHVEFPPEGLRCIIRVPRGDLLLTPSGARGASM